MSMSKKFMGRTYHDRGHAYKKLKQYNKALDDFGTSISLEPKDALIKGEEEKAKKYFNLSLKEGIGDLDQISKWELNKIK